MAAKGCVSGTLSEWPMLKRALNEHGYDLLPSTPAGMLRSICRIILDDIPQYDPQYDQAALDRLAEAGKIAWADVPNADDWIRELRGG